MKKYICENTELNELLVANGINLTCNEDMDIIITDSEAERIDAIVREQAEAALCDYFIEEIVASGRDEQGR